MMSSYIQVGRKNSYDMISVLLLNARMAGKLRDSYGRIGQGEIPQGFARGSSPPAHGKRVISRPSKHYQA